LPEETVAGTHWNDEGMTRRLKGYAETNESAEGNSSVKDFFEEHSTRLLTQEAEGEEEKLVEAFKVFIERDGKPFNYMTGDSENEKERIAKLVEIEKKRHDEEEQKKEL
jgi:hypothetical protein